LRRYLLSPNKDKVKKYQNNLLEEQNSMAKIVLPNQRRATGELRKAIFKAKTAFIMAGFFSMFINLLMLVPTLYMLQLYGRVVTSRSQETLIMLTAIVVVLFITLALLEIVRSRVLIRISNKMDSILNKRVFDSLFKLAEKYPNKASSSALSDLTQIRQFMTGNGLFAFFDAPWLPIYVAVLFLFHPDYGYFSLVAIVILLVITTLNEYSTKSKLQEANKFNSEAMMYVNSNLRNAEVIHAMGMKDNIGRRWQDKHYKFLNAQSKASASASIWANTSKITRMMLQSLMLGLGGYLAINNEVGSGMMIAGSIMLGRALAPLDLMVNTWKQFSGARTSYTRLNALLNDFPKEKEYMELPAPTGELLLEQIVVVPPNGKEPSIRGISMKIDKGDVVGIIGPSAAGKSSLARAVLGLWPLANGKVRLDGADISQWDKVKLGQYIGYLPQDIELFEGTVSENIARFGEIDAKKVVEAAQKAGVHEMILKLPDGYDTKIGIGGSSLSGGQRQRIGLVRAIYNNPILVVLDEPNSNLDEFGELGLIQAINSLKQNGSTVIIITHRPNILQVTNKMAVMKNGLLEMYGNSNEVLAKLRENSAPKPQNRQPSPAKPTMQKVTLGKPSN
jgi:ATP-binding cassette subfamily C protein EexD